MKEARIILTKRTYSMLKFISKKTSFITFKCANSKEQLWIWVKLDLNAKTNTSCDFSVPYIITPMQRTRHNLKHYPFMVWGRKG